jgi:hypothetical protein
MLVYQIFTLSSPGIDSQKLLNLRTKNVQWLAAHMCVKSCFAYEKKQNTWEITTDGHVFVIDYEGDFSRRLKPNSHELAANK